MSLLPSWRWYGPNDSCSLSDIAQVGASGIVHALHHIPVGNVWSEEEISIRKYLINNYKINGLNAGLTWEVVESLNVHNDIKLGNDSRDKWISFYIDSLYNLSKNGIHTVCYNFMPVLDWTRSDLYFGLTNGAKTLRYQKSAVTAFDLFILKRQGAENDYSPDTIFKAEQWFSNASDDDKLALEKAILQGVPGSKEVLTLDQFRSLLSEYHGVTAEQLRANLKYFLQRIIPYCEKLGINLCIHPDDPPFSIFGIPRVVSSFEDIEFIMKSVQSVNNGLTFCAGSLSASLDNNLEKILSTFADRIHFVHLRSVEVEEDGSFYEASHLEGRADLFSLLKLLILESKRREKVGRTDFRIPYRPDHGHQLLDDLTKTIPFHGYSTIGRMKGLAELRGMENAINRMLK
jgi:mannonate dehydratase